MTKQKIYIKIVIFFGLLLLNELYYMPIAPSGMLRPYSRRRFQSKTSLIRICFSEQRVFMGGCDLYDQEHEGGLLTASGMDFATAEKLLIQGNYIKKPIKSPTDECHYTFFKKNEKEYGVNCTLHGSAMHSIDSSMPGPSTNQPVIDERFEKEKENIALLKSIAFYGAIVLVLAII